MRLIDADAILKADENSDRRHRMELERCPYCGETARLVSIQNGFAIVCNDKNCLGQMQIHFGSCNNEEIFLEKLVSNWNKREPEINAVVSAVECIEEYRNTVYEETQEPYDEHGHCCIAVLDEVINRLKCFTSFAAVKTWIRTRKKP